MATFYSAASADDAVQTGSTVVLDDNSPTINGTNNLGVRVRSVTVAQGTTISSAYLKFDALGGFTGGGTTLNSTLYGEASDNSSVFSTASNNITGRSRTSANVANPPSSGTWEGAGIDVTSITQEILNRAGWSSGNAISFLLIGAGSGTNYIAPYMYDYFSGFYKTQLIITTTTVPTITTQAATSIDKTTATGNGNITATGGATPDKRGFVYSTSSQSLPGNVAPGSSGYSNYAEDTGSYSTGAYTNSITSLSKNTTYYIRAYSHNSVGYAYGGELSFTTLPGTPLIDAISSADLGFDNQTSGGDTSPFNSGDTIQYTVQGGAALTDTVTYYWRVKAKDPTGSNTFSGWSTTRSFTVSAPSSPQQSHSTDTIKRKAITKTHTTDASTHGAVWLSKLETWEDILTQDYTVNNTGSYIEVQNTASPNYYRHQFNWDPSKWDNVTAIYFESQINTDAAATTVYVQLYNQTDSVAITGASLSTTNQTFDVTRSADIKGNMPSTSKVLQIRVYTDNAGRGFVNSGRLVIQQDAGTKFRQTFALAQADYWTNSTTPHVDEYANIWLYEATKFNNIEQIIMEVNAGVYGTNTATFELWDITDGVAVSGGTVSTSATSGEHLVSSDVKANLIDGHEYSHRVTNSASGSGIGVGWGGVLIRIDQNYATKTQQIMNGIFAGLFADTENDGVQLDPAAYDSAYGKEFWPEITYINNSSTGTGDVYAKDVSTTEITNSRIRTDAGDTLFHRKRGTSQMPWPSTSTFYRPRNDTVVSPGTIPNVWRGVINLSVKETGAKLHTTDSLLRRRIDTLGSSTTTYYFDGHTSITDSTANWTNDANAFDGSTATYATNSASSTTGVKNLVGVGTTAPSSGATITQVRARIYDARSLAPADFTASANIYDSSVTLLGTLYGGLGTWGTYVTLSAPSGGWTWAEAAGLAASIFGDSGRRPARIDLEITSSAPFAHTADAYKLKVFSKSHTTSANKRKATTLSHTTDSSKRVAGTTRTHTTDSLKRTQSILAHTTSSVIRKANSVNHITDALKRKTNTVTHTTNANKRTSGTLLTHTASSNKKVFGNTRSHTTDSFKRGRYAVSHTTDSRPYKLQFSDLIDDFNDNTVNTTKWSNTNVYTETNQRAEFFASGNGTFSRLLSAQTLSLTGNSIFFKYGSSGISSNASIIIDIRDGSDNHIIRLEHLNSGTVNVVNSSYSVVASVTYNSTTTAWWRFRETSGTLYVEYATAPTSWTTLYSVASPGGLGTAKFSATGSTFGNTFDNASGWVDNVNVSGAQYTITHTTDSNKRRSGLTLPHTTDANKRKITTVSHSTDANKKRADNTVSHTTDANKKITGRIVSHTTNALLRRQLTLTHTTDAIKRTLNVLTHTTSSVIRKANTVAHTTDSNKRRATTVDHTTDSNLRRAYTVSHETDANKRLSGNTVFHTTDANKRTSGNIVSHTTNALKRTQTLVTHTTDALLRKAQTLTHTTNAVIRTANVVSHATDANLRRAYSVSHTTNANKRLSGNVVSHTTNALKRATGTLTHSTDALKKTRNVLTHTTSSFLRRAIELTHSTNAFLRKGNQVNHTTDSNKRKITTVVHSTDANKRKLSEIFHTINTNLRRAGLTLTHTTNANKRRANNTLSHTTSSIMRKANVLYHTTNALKRTLNIVSHTTDVLKKIRVELSHSTDSFLRRAIAISHTTNANKKRIGNLASHAADAFKRGADEVFHNTDANKRKALTISYTTDASKKVILSVAHTTNTLLRRALTLTHATDANKRRSTLVSHTTNALKRAANLVSHTTSSNRRRVTTVAHTTDALLRSAITIAHTTSSSLRKASVVFHSTDTNKRKATAILHTADAFLHGANRAFHTTDANKKKANSVAHSTDALFRRAQTLTHTTDVFLRKAYTLAHSTNAFLRRARTVSHTTSSNKKKANTLSHTTSAVLTGQNAAGHTTDANTWKQSGTKRVLVNGVWEYGIVKVLDDATWKTVPVYYWNGTEWLLSSD